MRNLVASLQQFGNGDKLDIQMRNMQGILESMNLRARVRLVGGMQSAVWEGRVVRFSESIDPTRRTLGVVVAIDNPYDQIIPGERPPLLKGMFTAVELMSPSRDALLVPLKAIHQGRVYIADADNKLEIRPVSVRVQQGDIALVGKGLAEDEKLVINDLVPVIEGMPLKPVVDESFAEQFRNKANGVAH
jgi:multidrug efflux pump subunit AcrA (membrane-fusion protein)